MEKYKDNKAEINRRPIVLVTNDDGIDAEGIKALVRALSEDADVYVFAPAEQQSGKSHAITYLHPITVEEREFECAAMAFAVTGTPADCVKVGLVVMEEHGIEPDYVFSGINHGYNSGLIAYYSGTVAAAREGAINGVRSIALSHGNHGDADYEYLLGMLSMLMYMADRIEPDVLLNVNVPDIPPEDLKGYKVVEAAPSGYGLDFTFFKQEDGSYQMDGFPARRGGVIRYDMDANEEGYVSIAPIPTSMSDKVSLSKIQDAYAGDDVLAVIVDAQEDAVSELAEPQEFRSKIALLCRCLNRMDIPVLLTERYGKGDIIEEVTDNSSRCERAERMASDPWMSKEMLHHTSLIDAKKVMLAGTDANGALTEAAVRFIDRGYEVTIIEDCVSSSDTQEQLDAILKLKTAGAGIARLETAMKRLASGREDYLMAAVERLLGK